MRPTLRIALWLGYPADTRGEVSTPAMNMQRCLPSLSYILAFAAFVLCSVQRAAAEDASQLGEPAGEVAVPPGISKGDVQNAIVATLLGRQWGVTSKSDGRVVGYLKHRTHEATVTLIYTTTQVEVYCVGWLIDKSTGARLHPEQPRGWLKNIRSDLTKRLNNPAAPM